MGRLDVPVRIANPDSRASAEEIELLVDTGATFTVLPADMWERLGLTAEFPRRLRTADGRVLQRGQGLAYVELDGHSGTVPVIEGGVGDMPVLGVTTLEILGLLFDPVKGELRPTEYLYL
jgi:clan AA aspartic protease